jgi:hypothetical protein
MTQIAPAATNHADYPLEVSWAGSGGALSFPGDTIAQKSTPELRLLRSSLLSTEPWSSCLCLELLPDALPTMGTLQHGPCVDSSALESSPLQGRSPD